MIQLDSKTLPAAVQRQLTQLQQKVDTENTFAEKAAKAQSLWDSKGGKKGKEAFETIVETLYSLCVFVGVCNYCEQSEANDVEHIYPKSFFPEHAFNWDNYLLACKQCNSGLKLDTFFVLDASDEPIELQRGQAPPFTKLAFINPRIENPNTFMLLALPGFTFELLPGLSKGDQNKALKTLEILQLNNRDILLAARKSAAEYYYLRMELLIRLLDAPSITAIEALLPPYYGNLDPALTLEELKQNFKESFKIHITTYQHPSVWHVIKVIGSQLSPKWKRIFAQLPEALNW
ncbi:HNH endonuclease [Cytophagaceae bacterium YF14B1]|uniref:HNH endonuclease n=1 Tax=Xanthocytophaga flava TaxID=3048013 RepID=A0AAE3QSI4_9BACT|nr:HNH endonuclease [Xanthocytophaga flavus]MDJ1482455.1 HNH endonuclease [Xanthocytophaga flavus]